MTRLQQVASESELRNSMVEQELEELRSELEQNLTKLDRTEARLEAREAVPPPVPAASDTVDVEEDDGVPAGDRFVRELRMDLGEEP